MLSLGTKPKTMKLKTDKNFEDDKALILTCISYGEGHAAARKITII